MSFDSIKINDTADRRQRFKSAHKKTTKRWSNTTDQKRQVRGAKISTRRIIGSALSLIFAFFMLYAALFYVPAYKYRSELLSISTHKGVPTDIKSQSASKSLLQPYHSLFKIRRTYLRAGQTLNLRYSLPSDTELFIYIKRCHAPIIIEVFYCKSDSPIKQSKKLKRTGELHFTAEKAGLYLYDDMLFNENSKPSNQPYMAVWTRK